MIQICAQTEGTRRNLKKSKDVLCEIINKEVYKNDYCTYMNVRFQFRNLAFFRFTKGDLDWNVSENFFDLNWLN